MSIYSIPSYSASDRLPLLLPVAPAFRRLPPPLIIVGMHRSGTSLAGGLLHDLGVYIDPTLGVPGPDASLMPPDTLLRRSGYGEAVAFRLLNEAVMRSADATWNDVLSFLARRDIPDFACPNLLRMELATYGSLSWNYLGLLPRGFTGVWGWKDPRNSLTLPYWLRLFPDARILHVRRNPDAVARSLMQRATATADRTPAAPSSAARLWNAAKHPGAAVRALSRRVHPAAAPKTTPFDMSNRDDCLRLTELYVAECLHYRDHPGGYLEIQYEHILEDPNAVIQTLAAFVGIEPSAAQRQRAAAFVMKG